MGPRRSYISAPAILCFSGAISRSAKIKIRWCEAFSFPVYLFGDAQVSGSAIASQSGSPPGSASAYQTPRLTTRDEVIFIVFYFEKVETIVEKMLRNDENEKNVE